MGLNCPNGEEANIIDDNMELVDLGLVEEMGQYADYLREQSQAGGADFLEDMAAQLTTANSDQTRHKRDYLKGSKQIPQ